MPTKKFKTYQEQVEQELNNNILPFWYEKTIDTENGGFIGRMTNDIRPVPDAPKGLILNTRILWTFSAVYHFNRDPRNLQLAERAYHYVTEYFLDPVHGGAYWMLDAKGRPHDDKKKVYGQAFTIYALAEYYLATHHVPAIELAQQLFHLLESKTADNRNGGYFETFNRDWSMAEDLRLSDKDMNEKKSMNTHLHMLEAYANLYRAWRDKSVAKKLAELLDIFSRHIVQSDTHSFQLFFDEESHGKSDIVSFGHDIEGSWLLYEAAEILQNKKKMKEVQDITVQMAQKVYNTALDSDGGLFYEGHNKTIIDPDKHWWPQAEAAVGFLNAFSISEQKHFYDASYNCWQFITQYIVDKIHGEWFWKVDRCGQPAYNEFKVSEWKGPYHNSRACMEIIKRLTRLITKKTK
jgi:mannobiose 2-epimerase